jgi:hypothetical protein
VSVAALSCDGLNKINVGDKQTTLIVERVAKRECSLPKQLRQVKCGEFL